MPASVRHTDICTGHGCYPPRPNAAGSPNVYTNLLAEHRVTDPWQPHCCPPVCHASTQASGSPNVFTNLLSCARVGDQVACGSSNAMGSPNVFVNG